MRPRWPIFIPSKSRADTALTPDALERLGVEYRLIVEDQQHDAYAARYGADRLLVLPPSYQADYDSCDDEGDSFSKGSGPARNFIWDTAQAEGHDWHWLMDDNIRGFYRTHQNHKYGVADGLLFHAMETFAMRYRNIAMAGPQYEMFMPARQAAPPFIRNTRIYSCNLIRTAVPMRWRGRYNEDTILSLDLLKAGWCTALFYAFLQKKTTTQTMGGGNTEAFYAQKGTLPKSEMLVRLHPDVTRLVQRYGRWHHHVNYKAFDHLRFVPDPDAEPVDPELYRMTLQTAPDARQPTPKP